MSEADDGERKRESLGEKAEQSHLKKRREIGVSCWIRRHTTARVDRASRRTIQWLRRVVLALKMCEKVEIFFRVRMLRGGRTITIGNVAESAREDEDEERWICINRIKSFGLTTSRIMDNNSNKCNHILVHRIYPSCSGKVYVARRRRHLCVYLTRGAGRRRRWSKEEDAMYLLLILLSLLSPPLLSSFPVSSLHAC